MRKLHPLIATFAVVACTAIAQAQTGTSTPGTGAGTSPDTGANAGASGNSMAQSTLSETERNFMRDAAQAGHAELQASQLALTRATDPAVKEFAQQVIDDHTQANAQLQQIAQAKGMTLPTEASSMHRSKLKSLESKEGSRFDHQYIEDFGIQAHRRTVEQFRKEAQNGQDTDVKSFAQQTLPALEKHLQHAMSMQGNRNKRGSTS